MNTSRRRQHGGRARRRADRRRRSRVVAAAAGAVLLVAVGGFAAALALDDDDGRAVTAPVAKRSAPPTTVTVPSTPATTVPGLPCRAGLSPDAPLRLWIAGDSIAHSVGTGLGKRAAGTGVVAPVFESRVSSGLASPGFFDWPRRVAEELPRLDPEIVVFVMGTNDWSVPQATPVDTTGQPAWKATYEQRVQSVVDALTAGGRTLYWVGPPVLRDTKQEAGAREIAAVIEHVVEPHPHAEYVDAHDLLDGDGGIFTAVVDVDGKKVQVRTGDGVHLTPDGADYVGDALFAELDAQCRIRAQAVAGTRQQVVETKGSTSVAPGATAPPTAPSATPPTITLTAPPATAPVPASTPTPSTTATTPPTSGTPQPTMGTTQPTTG